MKKLISIILLAFGLSFTTSLQAKDKIPVQICYDNQVVKEMSLEEWVALTDGAEMFYEELDAETDKPKRVRIVLVEDIWKISNPDKFETEMIVQWVDKDGDVFKEFILSVEIVIDEDTRKFSDWRIKYRDVAEIGFPISILFNILFIGLVILL
jgi:hypothetical protein